MSVVSNNYAMKCEYAGMKLSHEKYRSCDISGNYADLAKALALRRADREADNPAAIVTASGRPGRPPVLLEFITTQEVRYSNEATLNPPAPWLRREGG